MVLCVCLCVERWPYVSQQNTWTHTDKHTHLFAFTGVIEFSVTPCYNNPDSRSLVYQTEGLDWCFVHSTCVVHKLQAEQRVACVCACARDHIMMNASPAVTGDLCVAVRGYNGSLSLTESPWLIALPSDCESPCARGEVRTNVCLNWCRPTAHSMWWCIVCHPVQNKRTETHNME